LAGDSMSRLMSATAFNCHRFGVIEGFFELQLKLVVDVKGVPLLPGVRVKLE